MLMLSSCHSPQAIIACHEHNCAIRPAIFANLDYGRETAAIKGSRRETNKLLIKKWKIEFLFSISLHVKRVDLRWTRFFPKLSVKKHPTSRQKSWKWHAHCSVQNTYRALQDIYRDVVWASIINICMIISKFSHILAPLKWGIYAIHLTFMTKSRWSQLLWTF